MLKIRRANLADEKEIKNCVYLSYEMYISRLEKKPKPILVNYASLIKEKNFFVGECNGQIVGIIVLKNLNDYILLDNIAVIPSYQGKGIGKSLITFAENYTFDKRKNEIRLYTNIKMTENIGMYKKLGYIEYDNKFEDGYHRVYFRKPIQFSAKTHL